MRLFIRMRLIAAALASAIVAGANMAQAEPAEGQPGFSMSDFKLVTAQDLFDICTVEPANPMQPVAEAFCYGFFSGGKHYHDEVATIAGLGPVFCPPAPLNREEIVAVFVDYMKRNPDRGVAKPIDVIFEAGSERFPCPAEAAQPAK